MLKTLANAFKNDEIRRKMLITLALLFVYRLGCWLPVPGISAEVYNGAITSDSLFGLLSTVSGNALANGAFLAIGISPYINASIIVQLLTVAFPTLERWSKQGEDGRKKISRVTRITTLILAAGQAAGIVVAMANGSIGGTEATASALDTTLFGANTSTAVVAIFVAVILVAGSMFTMWLGERITEYGLSNGISLLIFVGIIASAGQSIYDQIKLIFSNTGDTVATWELIAFIVLVILIFLFIVWIDMSERQIPVNYAKQVKGRKQYGGQSTNIPIKVNANGVIPIIFATAVVTLPQLVAQLISPTGGFSLFWGKWFGTGSWAYSILVGLLILFFSYFYSTIQFQPDEIARNLQQYGGAIKGIRPGRATAEYLDGVSKRLTLFGAIFLAFIAIVPSILFKAIGFGTGLINAFSSTGLMIVVSVALEIQKQLESQLMMKHYKGFLK